MIDYSMVERVAGALLAEIDANEDHSAADLARAAIAAMREPTESEDDFLAFLERRAITAPLADPSHPTTKPAGEGA